AADAAAPAWHQRSPYAEIIGGLRAIVPLVLFLLLVLRFILKQPLRGRSTIIAGISLATVGMVIFNLGLTYGLAALGSQSGGLVPSAFMQIDAVANSPLYTFLVGLSIAVLFAWLLGFGATMAEPALNALGLTVENLSNGAFRKSMLMIAVSLGVACGISLGVCKIIFDWPVAWLVVPGYLLAVGLTVLSTEEYVNIAWDSAGVTTGPVTVPLVLAMGLGLGNAVGAVEGFAILAMASIGPIVSVQITGLWVQWKVRERRRRETAGSVELPAAETET
ncbi:MAG: DUF1538 domain-containing protein, partial [Gammaproteobacteria bacterium]|nr:DUF1538 domain-containing protein [Gammaproteobacteria bacterium]